MMNQRNRQMTFINTLIALLLTAVSGIAFAYPDYDGCKDCHGDFEDNNYVSKSDGSQWNESLMDGHETFVGDKCNACHNSGSFGTVYLNSSVDGTLSKSCVGCHGRQEDVNGSCVGGSGIQVECGGGAGLRLMHDMNVGAGTCGSCHSGDPAPVGENMNPFNFGKSGVQMMDACDEDSSESRYGSTGLDNDGDGPRDGNDSDCQQVVNTPPTQPGTLSASAVTTSSATVSWGASTDMDNDTITYQVDYRQNGVTAWSNGGSTTATSRALSGLASEQFYDVRVTPNDGTEDGPERLATNLFQTAAPVQTNCLDLGALAYDNWTKTDAGGTGSLPVGAVSSDYVRCKACHGWDRLGTDGGYVRRSRSANRPNAGADDADLTSRNISLAARNNTDVTADMIWHTGTGRSFSDGAGSWVELDDAHSADNKAAHSNGYTLGNQHPDFTNGALTQEQVGCLVEFLNTPSADPSAYFNNIDPGPNPVLYSIVNTANATVGESYYNSNCISCHGDPAGVSPVGSPEGGILAYLDGDGKYSEFAHKTRWGIPDTTMTREAMGTPDAGDVADMMLWLQQLGGSGFVINPGLSGNWWGGLSRSGEGFLIDVANNSNGDTVIVVSFYTYDSIGNQVWLIGNVSTNSNTAEIALLIPEGAMWGADYNPDDSDETPWGTGTFTFTSCGAGHVVLVPNEVMLNNGFTNLEYDIQRDILIPGIECPTPGN
jgi:mono/diheme cytochrome c family protein